MDLELILHEITFEAHDTQPNALECVLVDDKTELHQVASGLEAWCPRLTIREGKFVTDQFDSTTSCSARVDSAMSSQFNCAK